MHTAVQLYTLRGEGLEPAISRVGGAGFDGVEFAGLDGHAPAEVAELLDLHDLAVAGAHVSIDDLESDPEGVLESYGDLGCDRFVVPSHDPEAFESREGVEEAANRLSALADRLESEGATVHYHNHTFEFDRLEEKSAFDLLAEATDDRVGLEIDTGLAAHAGVDPLSLIERYADRLSLLHLTDTRAGSPDTHHVEYGTGEVDLDACLEAGREAGAEWVVAEHGTSADPPATVDRFAEVLV
ncbi:sugar phosphate isomerase/epimerase [Saliphagus sp. LR7]|uniref:sugar phosphate isomerase/epimerase family protein n=1 Tax=Saliphagus sp. LR7 TaxID=2282654 RepID=UPI000DF73485|nr:sugar phosphate isomerase/epimerase [Saliphagus sp. LR7]